MLQTQDPVDVDRRLPRPIAARTSTIHRLAGIWLVGLGILAVAAFQNRVPVEDLLLDRALVSGGKWYSGMVTSLVVVAWTTAAVSAFGAAFTSRVAGRGVAASAFASAGAIITLLMLDDLYQLHSSVVGPESGLPKQALMIVEGGAVIVWFVIHRTEIVRTRWELLVAAQVGFAVSLVVDTFTTPSTLNLVVEDGGKLLGVFALAMWAISTAGDLIVSAVRAAHH